MTPQEKIYFYTREALIEKHGEDFLTLDEKDQELLVVSTAIEYLKREREVKYE